MALLLKSDPSSRKLKFLDRRRKDAVRFEMISEDLFLVKMRGEDEDCPYYWTLLD